MKVVFNMRTFGADLEMCLFQRDSPSSPGFRECHKLPTLTRSVRGGVYFYFYLGHRIECIIYGLWSGHKDPNLDYPGHFFKLKHKEYDMMVGVIYSK